jgi:uroporphyrin-III C-methyltransferase
MLGTLGTIADIAERECVEAPAMLIIGEVAAFSERLSWFEPALGAEAAR